MSAFVRLVCHTPELQAYTTQKLYLALRQDVSQESLTLAGLWVIGEFGEVILKSHGGGVNLESEELVQEVIVEACFDVKIWFTVMLTKFFYMFYFRGGLVMVVAVLR